MPTQSVLPSSEMARLSGFAPTPSSVTSVVAAGSKATTVFAWAGADTPIATYRRSRVGSRTRAVAPGSTRVSSGTSGSMGGAAELPATPPVDAVPPAAALDRALPPLPALGLAPPSPPEPAAPGLGAIVPEAPPLPVTAGGVIGTSGPRKAPGG